MKGRKVIRSAAAAVALILMMAAPAYASKQVLTFNNSTDGQCGWSSGKDGNGWPTPNANAIAYKVSGEGIFPSDSTKPAILIEGTERVNYYFPVPEKAKYTPPWCNGKYTTPQYDNMDGYPFYCLVFSQGISDPGKNLFLYGLNSVRYVFLPATIMEIEGASSATGGFFNGSHAQLKVVYEGTRWQWNSLMNHLGVLYGTSDYKYEEYFGRNLDVTDLP